MSEKEYTLTVEQLKHLDSLYEDADDMTPTLNSHRHWGVLVEALRAIRRQVEAGVVVSIAGTDTVLRTWQDFYSWADGRYHSLEDDVYTKWIGDDS